MDSPPKMDVVDWQGSPPPVVPKTRPPRHFFPPTLIGIVGTVLLHAAFVQSVSFESRGSKPKPPETQDSASIRSKSTGADSLVLIMLPMSVNANLAASQNLVSSLPDLSKIKVNPRISADPREFLNLETLALSEEQAPNTTAGGPDGAELARLFGIYSGQIQARIDRVWRRPRTPVNGDAASVDAGESFQCEAQIVQDIRGNVQEILLPRCNGSPAWQHSLVVAIQQSSPLPAPPSPQVFAQSIGLHFVGLTYVADNVDDEYELVPRSAATSGSIGLTR